MIRELLENKTASEKSAIKSAEIVKLPLIGKYKDAKYGQDIEIVSVKEITNNDQHGIEIFVRAWKDGKQLGFGKDGTIETERVRIWNPPILIDTPTGDIIKTTTIRGGSEPIVLTRRLSENPIEAVRKDLAHTISLIGKLDKKIVPNSIGNTTSTFYPSLDGMSQYNNGNAGGGETWATIIAKTAGTYTNYTDANERAFWIISGTTANRWALLVRAFFLFDTSAIGTDTISSATLSVVGQYKADEATAITPTYNIYTSTPASTSELVNADFDQVGSTAQCDTAVAYASMTTDSSTHNNWAFNATGIGNINKSGISKFAGRDNYDATSTEPTWSSNTNHYWHIQFSETTGTAGDPKLVVVHAAGGGSTNTLTSLALMGVGM